MKKFFTLIVAIAAVFSLQAAEITVDDAAMTAAGTTVNWTSDNVYILNGMVFVNDGQTLNIEAGTVIKGLPGQEAAASALIVARGGMISAAGTASNPIIFTTTADNMDGTLPTLTSGMWGGIIVLGKGLTNQGTTDNAVEGIPTSETRGLYGGNDEADNSGSMSYVSIRHGGTDIGEGNEINGLTLGAVGSGTTFSYIEVVSNKDDGVEWFGGTPRCDHILVAWVGDDSFDYDQGYSGKNQFMVAVQTASSAGDIGDRLGEHDGGDAVELGTPFAHPVFSNVTYVGAGSDAGRRVVTMRDNAGGEYVNSIFASQAKGFDIEWRDDSSDPAVAGDPTGLCSYSQWADEGILKVENNIFQEVADGSGAGIFKVASETGKDENGDSYNKYTVDAAAVTAFADYFGTAGNTVANVGVDTFQLVPTGDVSGADFTGMDAFFTVVGYKGAFDPAGKNWTKGWTLYSSVNGVDTDVRRLEAPAITASIYPNPVEQYATIEFDNEKGLTHSFMVFDISGRKVYENANIEGSSFVFNRNSLTSGVYVYRLSDGKGATANGKMVLR